MSLAVTKSMLSKGTIVKGVWHKKTYRVYHELGRGAVGCVYVVENIENGKMYAMKVSHSMQAIASEYKRLDRIQGKVQSKHFGPLLFEMDDIQLSNRTGHYYTMEYIDGNNLAELRMNTSRNQYLQYICQIANHLQELHRKKTIFSDLKPENIMVESSNQQVRFVDFGGVVPIGRMVKQYSVLYDRGSWKMGSRTADIQFDLFAVGILLLQFFTKDDELRKAQKNSLPMYALYDIIHKELHPKVKQICMKIFSEKYVSAEQLSKELHPLASEANWETDKAPSRPDTSMMIDRIFWFSFAFMVGSIYYVVYEVLQ